MDGHAGHVRRQSLALVDRLPQKVEHAPKAGFANRHADGGARVHGLHAPPQAVGGAHGDAAGHVVADVLGDLAHQGIAV